MTYTTEFVVNGNNNREKMNLIVAIILPEIKFIRSIFEGKRHSLLAKLAKPLSLEKIKSLSEDSSELCVLIKRLESAVDYDEELVSDLYEFLNIKTELHQDLPAEISFKEDNIMTDNWCSFFVTKKRRKDDAKSIKTIACDYIYKKALNSYKHIFDGDYITFFSNNKAYSITDKQAKEHNIKENGWRKYAHANSMYHIDLHQLLASIIFTEKDAHFCSDGSVCSKWRAFSESLED